MSDKKIRVELVGNYLGYLIRPLKAFGIEVENIIQPCNPLSMSGKADISLVKYADDPKLPMNTLLNIRKNLDQMLSHNLETFCQNYNMQPLGKEVRRQNTSEYFIFMNSSSAIPIFEKKGIVYSEVDPPDSFSAVITNDKSYTKRIFPFSGDFNWRFYYDKFINTVLKEYDSEHIIFIKSNCAQWFMDNKEIKPFEKRSSEFRNLINEMDEYFIEKTHCMVINEHFNYIPPLYFKCWFPYILVSQFAWQRIANHINNIITGTDIDDYKPFLPIYGNALPRLLQIRLSSKIVKDNEESIHHIDRNWLTLNDIKKLQNENKFFSNLTKLEKFIDPENLYILSDYVLELSDNQNAVDISLIKLYTEYFKLDINDIIAVYELYIKTEDKSEFKDIVKRIRDNTDCLPVALVKKFKADNIEYLKKYPYIKYDFAEIEGDNDIYIRLENNCYLIFNDISDDPIRKIDNLIQSSVDHMKVINDEYTCSVEYADALTYSYDYYVEKARNGFGAKPTYLKFESAEDFNKSLNYIDYRSLLDNERFVFVIGGDKCTPSNYIPIVDLSVLMDPDLVSIRVSGGLCDQFAYYVMGNIIEDFSGRKVIYDDHCLSFNGLEVTKFAKRPMQLLSSKLSARLKLNDDTFNKIYLKINPYYVYFTNKPIRDIYKNTTTVMVRKTEHLIDIKLPYTYIHAIVHSHIWKDRYDFDLNEYIEFPPYEKEEHIELQKKMLSCDSVVIHVRRGDYLTAFKNSNKEANFKFYPEAIQKLLQIPDYPNKKYFVFSDDIQWCKTHLSEIGLDLVGDSEITYVDGNRWDESYRDIQLMTNGKIMIGGFSGFFGFAALYNEKCEVIMAASNFISTKRKNKYDVGPFKENYVNLIPDDSKK